MPDTDCAPTLRDALTDLTHRFAHRPLEDVLIGITTAAVTLIDDAHSAEVLLIDETGDNRSVAVTSRWPPISTRSNTTTNRARA